MALDCLVLIIKGYGINMCNRSKIEVMARELAIEYFLGMSKATQQDEQFNIKERVDKHWAQWKPQAHRLLQHLNEHKD